MCVCVCVCLCVCVHIYIHTLDDTRCSCAQAADKSFYTHRCLKQ